MNHAKTLILLVAIPVLGTPAGLVRAQEPPQAQDNAAAAGAPADSPPDASAAANAGAGTNTKGKNPAVCFHLTMQCMGTTEAPPATATAVGATANGSINLTPPDIRTVVSPQELSEPLPTPAEQQDAEEADTVQVRAAPTAPDVPGGFGALWWALRHPTQAWRIVAPVE